MRLYLSLFKKGTSWRIVVGPVLVCDLKEEGEILMFSQESKEELVGIEKVLKREIMNAVKIAHLNDENLDRASLRVDVHPSDFFPEEIKKISDFLLRESVW